MGVWVDLVTRQRTFGGTQAYSAYLDTKVDLGLAFRDISPVLAVATVLALVAVAIWRRSDRALWPAIAMLAVSAGLAYVWLLHVPNYYARMVFFVPVAAAPVVAAVVVRLRPVALVAAVAAAALVFTAVQSFDQAPKTRAFYAFANPVSLRGLDALAPRLAPDEVVVTDRCWSFLGTWLLHTRTLPALIPQDIQPKAELVQPARPGRSSTARRRARPGARWVRYALMDPLCPPRTVAAHAPAGATLCSPARGWPSCACAGRRYACARCPARRVILRRGSWRPSPRLRWPVAAVATLRRRRRRLGKQVKPWLGMVSEDAFVARGASRRDILAAQRRTGVQLLRQTFSWPAIETHRGRYDFRAYDDYMAATAGADIQVLPLVFGVPTFRAAAPARGATVTATTVQPPRRPADMAVFITVLVKRYGPGGSFWKAHPAVPAHPIQAWQVWNEPNLPAYWGGRPSAAAYVALLRAAHRAIKAADPAAQTVTAGLPDSRTGIGLDHYLRQMLAAGAKGTFDGLAIHPYVTADGVLSAASARYLLNRGGGLRRTPCG